MIVSNDQVTFGTLAVDCFFVISGYLITQSRMKSLSTDAYLVKRLFRIQSGVYRALSSLGRRCGWFRRQGVFTT